MTETLDPESRIAEVEANLQPNKTLTVIFRGKNFALSTANKLGHAYMLSVGGEEPPPRREDEPEPAVILELPSLIVYLDEFLNIVSQQGRGTLLGQQSINEIIDRMLEQEVRKTMKP